MISIQSMMLVALGFLGAALLGLLIFPAFWRRAVRLTAQRLKEQLPLTEAEIKADKDRLRAEYAIQVHKLEMQVERAGLERARQLIEINRRDATISQLEQDQSRLNLLVDENQNARRVLEQTVSDRLPKIEARLGEARTALFDRDREIAELTQNSKRHLLALEEAKAINAQQSSELERMTNALTVRGGRNQQALADPSFEGELALRAEIEALRSKAREQAGLIGRLQAQMAARPALMAPVADDGATSGAQPRAGDHLALVPPADETARATEREMRALKAKLEDQTAEIARLTVELDTLREGSEGGGLKDSKIALKARLNAAQSQVESQGETIKRLRAEIASANERLALQGAHFMEQMRRLGAGTLPAAGQQRRPVTQGQKLTLSERVAQSRPTLRPVTQTPAAEPPAKPAETKPPAEPKAVAEPRPEPVAELPPEPAAKAVLVEPPLVPPPPPLTINGAATESPAEAPARDLEPVAVEAGARKPRLIDRLSNMNKR